MNTPCGRRRFSLLAIWLFALLFIGWAPVDGFAPSAHAGMPLDLERELSLLRDGQVKIHISGARYRYAVFTFEDPDQTGLGNALATILSHDLLVNGKVSSLGVLRYLGDLAKSSDEKLLRYFEKVEPLIESQGVQVAVWGVIRRTEGGVRIDSYVQLSPAVMQKTFSFTFRPREMGGAPLVHRVGPDRLLAQRRSFTDSEAQSLLRVAENLDRLRTAPRDNAPVASTLPLGTVHYLVQRQGDWVKVAIQGGKSGWLRTKGFCADVCAPLLDVSRFATELMAYDEYEYRIPARSPSLTDDAKVFIDQLIAMDALNRASPISAEQEALAILKPWYDPQSGVPSPGGGATCNLRALVQIVGPSKKAAALGDNRPLERERIGAIASQLARDSLADPRHLPTLSNLSVLFGWLGDSERASLASQLAQSARQNSP